MFNSTTYRNESKVVAVTRKIEKTISPDKVTEMYDAVREQVMKDIIDVVRIESNQFKGVAVIMDNIMDKGEYRYKGKFELNGENFYIDDILFGREEVLNGKYGELINRFYEFYQKELTNRLIRESVKVSSIFNKFN